MSHSFMQSPGLLFTSESVTEGHPDKICDQISDAVLDAHLAADPFARVACEAAVKSSDIFLLGEITARPDIQVDYPGVVYDVLHRIGYAPDDGFGPHCHRLHEHFNQQSPDIAMGVSRDGGAHQGAGDQGMMFGFACDETASFMPLPIDLAHSLTRTLSEKRKAGILPWLRPDGKAQVTVEYSRGQPRRIHTVVLSTQHTDDVTLETIKPQLWQMVVEPVLAPTQLLDDRLICHVNPTGRFVAGGPLADAGLTGRKIIVDTYGGMGRHGGGAFSGKDCTKVDRSAAYMARLVAKSIVAAALAQRCEVQIAYAIGRTEPVSVFLETFGTGRVPDAEIEDRIRRHFDLTPAGIIQALNLRRPIYRATAAYGHFGREDLDLPWENLAQPPAAGFIQSWA